MDDSVDSCRFDKHEPIAYGSFIGIHGSYHAFAEHFARIWQESDVVSIVSTIVAEKWCKWVLDEEIVLMDDLVPREGYEGHQATMRDVQD